MGHVSTRMISASSHAKMALPVSTVTGDPAAWVMECDMAERGEVLGRASSSE